METPPCAKTVAFVPSEGFKEERRPVARRGRCLIWKNRPRGLAWRALAPWCLEGLCSSAGQKGRAPPLPSGSQSPHVLHHYVCPLSPGPQYLQNRYTDNKQTDKRPRERSCDPPEAFLLCVPVTSAETQTQPPPTHTPFHLVLIRSGWAPPAGKQRQVRSRPKDVTAHRELPSCSATTTPLKENKVRARFWCLLLLQPLARHRRQPIQPRLKPSLSDLTPKASNILWLLALPKIPDRISRARKVIRADCSALQNKAHYKVIREFDELLSEEEFSQQK